MQIKWIGAILIISGCGGYGFYLAANHNREVNTLQKLIALIEFMICELQFRMSPLPVLCRQAAFETSGVLRHVFINLSNEMESLIRAEANTCMHAAISKSPPIPSVTLRCLKILGKSLGRFDLNGQINELDNVLNFCKMKRDELNSKKDIRIRSYRTLSLCAGAALAILLI